MTAEMVEGSESRRVLRDGLLELLDRGQPGDGARNALGHRVKADLEAGLGGIEAEALLRQVLGDLIDLRVMRTSSISRISQLSN